MPNPYYTGRISRSKFYTTLLMYMIFAGIAIVLWGLFISDTLRLPEGAGLAFFIVMLILWTMAFVKRLHDLGKSGWWLWVPIYNLWLVILILFVRGTRGENKYGHDPIQMKWLEKNAPSFISLPEKEQQKIIRQMRIATGEIEEDA